MPAAELPAFLFECPPAHAHDARRE